MKEQILQIKLSDIRFREAGSFGTPDSDTIDTSGFGCMNCQDEYPGARLEKQRSGMFWCHCCGTLWDVYTGPDDEPTKPTKSRRINETAVVGQAGSACIGLMGPETPYIWFELKDGEKLEWTSENTPFMGTNEWGEGDTVQIQGFVRESTGRLFKVKVFHDYI